MNAWSKILTQKISSGSEKIDNLANGNITSLPASMFMTLQGLLGRKIRQKNQKNWYIDRIDMSTTNRSTFSTSRLITGAM